MYIHVSEFIVSDFKAYKYSSVKHIEQPMFFGQILEQILQIQSNQLKLLFTV